LKDVLLYIFENLDKILLKIGDVETKMISKFMQIDKIKSSNELNKEDLDKM
jgi:hypothetical protein